MMQLISNVISLGYTAPQVLNYIGKKVAHLQTGINTARQGGYSDEDILNFIARKFNGTASQKKGMQESLNSQENYLRQSGIKSGSERRESRNKAIGGAIGAAATAAGLYGAYKKYGQGLLGQGAQANPQMPSQQNPLPTGTTAAAPPAQVVQQAQQQAQVPGVPPNAAAPPVPSNAPAPAMPVGEGKQTLQRMGLLDKASAMMAAGNQPDIVAQMLVATAPQELRKNYKQNEQMIADAVADLFASSQQDQNGQDQAIQNSIPQESSGQETVSQQGNQIASPFQEASSLQGQLDETPEENSDVIALPSGEIGNVVDRKDNHLIVDVGGKKRPVKLDEAIDVPASQEELGDLYANLIQRIPESERSSMINMAGYDPNFNELIFKPHDGAFYVYKDIPPEFAEKLQQAMFNAKTTGQNFYGAWTEGESSRGAGLSALIKELQKLYGGKGKEYSRKYETIYDILALPKQAVKAKEKALRDAKRQRKKTNS